MYRFKLEYKKKSRKNWLVFSYPQTNQYQTISNLSVAPQPYLVVKEDYFSNQIAVVDRPAVEIQFSHQPLAVAKQLSDSMEIGDCQNTVLLRPSRFINGNDKRIKEMAKKIVGESKILNDVIKKLYDFSINYLTYGKPIDGLYPYTQALEEKITDCGGFSTFLSSLFQSLNIPARLVVGYLLKINSFNSIFSILNSTRLADLNSISMHAWLEVELPGKNFFPLDPSMEWRRVHGKTSRKGGFGYIPADRLVVSYGEDFDLKINDKTYKLDLLQKPVCL